MIFALSMILMFLRTTARVYEQHMCMIGTCSEDADCEWFLRSVWSDCSCRPQPESTNNTCARLLPAARTLTVNDYCSALVFNAPAVRSQSLRTSHGFLKKNMCWKNQRSFKPPVLNAICCSSPDESDIIDISSAFASASAFAFISLFLTASNQNIPGVCD